MTAFDGIEHQTGAVPQAAILWLHGLGADGSDFMPIVPELVRADWPPLRFVFPHAPVQPVSLNGGMRMRAWYDLHGLDRDSREDVAGLLRARQTLDGLIEREVARGVDAARVFVAGFSQGGSVALASLLASRQALGGAILLSTWMPRSLAAVDALPEHVRRTPVFMAHGRHDPLVACDFGEASAQRLRALGLDVEWRSYPIEHGVSLEEIADLGAWLDPRLRSPA